MHLTNETNSNLLEGQKRYGFATTIKNITPVVYYVYLVDHTAF